MALVVPAIAGFGIFLIHKNKNKNKNIIDRTHCDGFINKHNLLNQSTPVVDNVDVHNINEYKDANNSFTDKYYSKKNNEEMNYKFNSINGEQINRQEFNHNNMVPYFGKSKLNGNNFMENAPTDSILDSRQEIIHFLEKRRISTLFKPENIQWAMDHLMKQN